MENRIKECQLDLFADRTRPRQCAYFAPAVVGLDGYALLCALAASAWHTPVAEATCGTIRLRLLKLGALVRHQCSTHQGRDGLGMPVSERVWSRLHPPQKCRRSLTEPDSAQPPHTLCNVTSMVALVPLNRNSLTGNTITSACYTV